MIQNPDDSGDNKQSITEISVSAPKSRDLKSDYLKSLAIISVVLIHASIFNSDIFRFCVPLFIAIWSFHYEIGLTKNRLKPELSHIVSRLKKLFIPYIFWTTVYLLLFKAPSDWSTTKLHTIIGGWFGGYGWAGQYFFLILFQLTILFPLFRKFVNARNIWLLWGVGTVINSVFAYSLFKYGIIAAINDRLFVYWLPYATLGIAAARGYIKSDIRLLPLAIILFLAIPYELGYLRSNGISVSAYVLPTVNLGTASLFIALSPQYNKPSLLVPPFIVSKKVLACIGENSFVIFVSHILFLTVFKYMGMAPETGIFIVDQIDKLFTVFLAILAGVMLGPLLQKAKLGYLVGK
jgi:hypothetical protein